MTTEQIFGPLEPRNWLISCLKICPGAPAMLAGYGGSGKSMVCQSLALSVCSGVAIWGAINEGVKGKVLHLDYEQGEDETRWRYASLLQGLELCPQDLEGNLEYREHPPVYLDEPRAAGWLETVCEGARMCIIDSLKAAAPGVEENSSDARRTLDTLGRVSSRTGCCFLVIHHARKKAPNGTPEDLRETIRGSGALYDACASVMVLETDEEERTLHNVKVRSGRTAQPMVVTFHEADAGGLFVGAEEAPSREERTKRRRAADRAHVMGRIREYMQGANVGYRSARQLAELLDLEPHKVSGAITQLEAEGVIRREGTGARQKLLLNDPENDPAQAELDLD